VAKISGEAVRCSTIRLARWQANNKSDVVVLARTLLEL